MTIGKRFDLLVFDWDGTVVDSAAHIVHSIQSAARDLSLEVPSDAQARHIIGLGLHDAMTALFPALLPVDYMKVADRYRHHYVAGDQMVDLFAGARDGLRGFTEAGFLLAVATGKSRRGLDRSLEVTGVGASFVATRCADEGLPKPDPDMLFHLMEKLGVAAERTVMIGDTTHDLEMARRAGVSAIAAGYGAHPPANLTAMEPLACVESFSELAAWITANA